jgi:hypothetical protein
MGRAYDLRVGEIKTMAKRRKTVDVSEVLARVNAFLAREDPYVTADMRKGAYILLEGILHETGNYAGFNNLGWMNGGHDRWVSQGKPDNREPYIGDDTRRHYYTKAEAPARVGKVAAEPGYFYPRAL